MIHCIKRKAVENMFFEKRKTVFEERNKALWEKAKQILAQAGIQDMKVGYYEKEPPMCGCGAKLDPRNFSEKGYIDRNYYYILVPATEYEKAKEILQFI